MYISCRKLTKIVIFPTFCRRLCGISEYEYAIWNFNGTQFYCLYCRLQERFISPQSVGSPCPQPSFPGCQEFFRDFVIIASSYMFNHHLTHTMVEKINDVSYHSTIVGYSKYWCSSGGIGKQLRSVIVTLWVKGMVLFSGFDRQYTKGLTSMRIIIGWSIKGHLPLEVYGDVYTFSSPHWFDHLHFHSNQLTYQPFVTWKLVLLMKIISSIYS